MSLLLILYSLNRNSLKSENKSRDVTRRIWRVGDLDGLLLIVNQKEKKGTKKKEKAWTRRSVSPTRACLIVSNRLNVAAGPKPPSHLRYTFCVFPPRRSKQNSFATLDRVLVPSS